MSTGSEPPRETRSAEERAERLMERVAADGSRLVSKFVGRVREEVEDIVAEAKTMHERSRGSRRK